MRSLDWFYSGLYIDKIRIVSIILQLAASAVGRYEYLVLERWAMLEPASTSSISNLGLAQVVLAIGSLGTARME